ncbi:conserved protein of unknown function (plasmid) [Rhodovastum atsumiense]|uniref:Uncharacterized protein n=1 Tax=Rhodovastum atsumiense TaxID=504468 RepID=A0A5M6IQ76_9PROT|nr:hypothetical protein [Rhodovastum atsumiense]KAA5609625.1 hypothetical protein F1189_22955 [Rhodovastum atsumiense]CAH2606487.1 conserved protein of unknown function [Rhodovastum atsumiense]
MTLRDTIAREVRIVLGEHCVTPAATDSMTLNARVEWRNSLAREIADAVLAALAPVRADSAHTATPADSAVIAEIAAERRRQVEAEGWAPAHDDAHRRGELAGAAACYVLYGLRSAIGEATLADRVRFLARDLWPWDSSWWKPKDRRRDMVRAAALIVAEIERLDRAAKAPAEGGANA